VFDPQSPDGHRCPRCNREHAGKRHHRAWVWRYHIWLSERAVHLALLGALTRDPDLSDSARFIIEGYAKRYRNYPNSDNVLGPTRLFFSTYLESIWLTQLVMAALMLESGSPTSQPSLTGFDEMVKESAGLIASFDEGWSNRQVWNNTALVAAGLWFGGAALPGSSGDRGATNRTFHRLLAHGLDGPHGLCPQLVSAVTDEGMWHEGENYHFFALRGFLIAAELLRLAGVDLYGDDGPHDRLRDMFVAPLRTVLPDLTLPARGDSPFGVSLLQPRFAEFWEIGWARTCDPRLQSLLAELYSAEVPEGEDPGFEEIAEQEQNRSAQCLHRGLLGWKALWLMNPDEPRAHDGTWKIGSTLLPQAGVAVFRGGADRYVSVECGGPVGGHGHPDLLHLTLFAERPLLMDFGTASYVSPSLHWYRSTLAHNAPSVSGEDQKNRNGWCAAIDQRKGWGWCRAVADDLFGAGTTAIRTIVLGPNCVLDIVDVEGPEDLVVDLPVHLLDHTWVAMDEWLRLPDISATSDGTLGDVLEWKASNDVLLKGELHTVILPVREGERLLVADRPGPPDDQLADGHATAFLVRRARGSGRWVQCFGLNTKMPVGVRVERQTILLEYGNGSADSITIKEDRCRIVDRLGEAHKLGGARQRPERQAAAKVRSRTIFCPRLEDRPSPEDWETAVPGAAVVELGAAHYRRSETPYGAGRPFSARAAVFVAGTELCFAVRVNKKNVTFRRADAKDPALDNETPDIHSDGIQCYLGGGAGDGWCGYLLVPDPDSESVRVAAVAGTAGNTSEVTALWARNPDGYAMLVAIDLEAQVQSGQKIPVNLVINEMYSTRERRAGQLALSGGGWVYLRGDREHPASAVVAEVS
jgi:hypothetical protein